MFKPINFKYLRYLRFAPAVLGYLFATAAIILAVAMIWPRAAHAAETLHCAQHKTFLGLHDGWDCEVPAATTDMTVITGPGAVWCNQGATLCKATGHATLRMNEDALAALGKPRAFQIALDCITTPGSADAACKFAVKAEAK